MSTTHEMPIKPRNFHIIELGWRAREKNDLIAIHDLSVIIGDPLRGELCIEAAKILEESVTKENAATVRSALTRVSKTVARQKGPNVPGLEETLKDALAIVHNVQNPPTDPSVTGATALKMSNGRSQHHRMRPAGQSV